MFLLDTHVWIWFQTDSLRPATPILEEILDPQNAVYLSITSVWEAQIKQNLNKLTLPVDIVERTKESGIDILDLDLQSINELKNLPDHHRDPFDRIMIAQAKAHNLKLITRDKRILAYSDYCKVHAI
ncbi:type II toxin-antitoxin system VapC family toxin [Coleofasciculus sp. LEGE 07081]|uniref:type II toxin-antitoxin system VapC family toxin n=1 Tax=Coleofasciculus sp. LEGE 07081 TaxID=2777967 RepID=UPI0018830344|nr:type II toxin-antitoxin system VapC family toxin [Coleofasciculus sp. LEGE 07081]MBE9130277.1 type II toxin-antitoxin system VapC family toxin [Coleofasciculus sp. LEGE 07081]